MTIGMDGGALSITDDRLKVGVYRVAYHLVKELPRLDSKNNYRVYGFERGEEGNPDLLRQNMQFVRLPRFGFQKIWQPLELVKHPIEVYLGISQSLPLTLYDVTNIGFIYDVGFLDHPEFYRESYFALSRQTASVVARADHIVTISRASAARIREIYRVPEEKLTVAYLGVDPAFTAHGVKHTRAHPYFLFVGSLKPGKNVSMMLRSFARFREVSGLDYEFLLVGSDYWLDPSIGATINALNLRQCVHLLGFADDQTLATYYRGAAAVVSVSLIEGFGLPVVEAMACDTPVIASSVGSYPEVVSSAGLLVDPQDEEGLSRALYDIVTDAGRRRLLIDAGRRRVKRFTWSAFAKSVRDAMGRASAAV